MTSSCQDGLSKALLMLAAQVRSKKIVSQFLDITRLSAGCVCGRCAELGRAASFSLILDSFCDGICVGIKFYEKLIKKNPRRKMKVETLTLIKLLRVACRPRAPRTANSA